MPRFHSNMGSVRPRKYRQDTRFDHDVSISYAFVNPETHKLTSDQVEAELINISSSGICFIMNEEPPILAQLDIILTLENMPEKIEIEGKVLWSKWSEEHKGHKVGIRFESKLPESLDPILRKYQ